jgi:transposase
MVVADGLGPVEVAHRLRVSRQSVYEWVRRYRLQGADGIAPKVRPGPQARLQLLQERRLTEVLLKGARAAGYRTDLWTRRRVREIIVREFGVDYHTDHISRVLARMGWTCQKPERQARERNPLDVEQWIKERWLRI